SGSHSYSEESQLEESINFESESSSFCSSIIDTDVSLYSCFPHLSNGFEDTHIPGVFRNNLKSQLSETFLASAFINTLKNTHLKSDAVKAVIPKNISNTSVNIVKDKERINFDSNSSSKEFQSKQSTKPILWNSCFDSQVENMEVSLYNLLPNHYKGQRKKKLEFLSNNLSDTNIHRSLKNNKNCQPSIFQKINPKNKLQLASVSKSNVKDVTVKSFHIKSTSPKKIANMLLKPNQEERDRDNYSHSSCMELQPEQLIKTGDVKLTVDPRLEHMEVSIYELSHVKQNLRKKNVPSILKNIKNTRHSSPKIKNKALNPPLSSASNSNIKDVTLKSVPIKPTKAVKKGKSPIKLAQDENDSSLT
ncbi:hypothetical protein HZS_3775, partial [Henneguya salminicola]